MIKNEQEQLKEKIKFILIKIAAYEKGIQIQRDRIQEFKKTLLKYNKELQKYE